jgi:hypothetical protein
LPDLAFIAEIFMPGFCQEKVQARLEISQRQIFGAEKVQARLGTGQQRMKAPKGAER